MVPLRAPDGRFSLSAQGLKVVFQFRISTFTGCAGPQSPRSTQLLNDLVPSEQKRLRTHGMNPAKSTHTSPHIYERDSGERA